MVIVRKFQRSVRSSNSLCLISKSIVLDKPDKPPTTNHRESVVWSTEYSHRIFSLNILMEYSKRIFRTRPLPANPEICSESARKQLVIWMSEQDNKAVDGTWMQLAADGQPTTDWVAEENRVLGFIVWTSYMKCIAPHGDFNRRESLLENHSKCWIQLESTGTWLSIRQLSASGDSESRHSAKRTGQKYRDTVTSLIHPVSYSHIFICVSSTIWDKLLEIQMIENPERFLKWTKNFKELKCSNRSSAKRFSQEVF